MKIPKIIGTIDRRILINYQVDAEVVARILPNPFRPKLVKGKAIVGICLIRLKNIRPKGMPEMLGLSSENGAYRIAVEWTDQAGLKEGVYIPRRDTSSKLNALVGGRVFPGVHHLAKFTVDEQVGQYHVQFKADDDTFLSIRARETATWSSSGLFENLAFASQFFEKGAVGYSPDVTGRAFDGLELKTLQWKVTPLEVAEVRSSFFENKEIFPPGSISFDNALLMKNIAHEWCSLDEIPRSKSELVLK